MKHYPILALLSLFSSLAVMGRLAKKSKDFQKFPGFFGFPMHDARGAAPGLKKAGQGTYTSEVRHNINFRVLFHVMNLAASKNVHPQVNALADQKIRDLMLDAGAKMPVGPIQMEMVGRINNFYEHP